MFEITVEREFCAAHALVLGGVREPVHGHNFRLTVAVAGERLDADGLLLDFHALERVVDEIIQPLHNTDLNALPALAGRGGPSAEHIAKHIADLIEPRLTVLGDISRRVWLAWVRLTEAPGCAVIYRPTYPDSRSGR